MEKAHDISLDEPCVAHQAILFMLDVLMRNNSAHLPLAELYDSFGDRSFTPQMLRAVGGNEQGLRQFLQRYPSLFTVSGDAVAANSGGSQLPQRANTTPERYLRKKKSGEPSEGTQARCFCFRELWTFIPLQKFVLKIGLISKHTDLFFCSMLHAQNFFYIHILYTQKDVYSIFE